MLDIKKELNQLKITVEHALKRAKQLGAEQAEVGASVDEGYGLSVRLGDVENVSFQRDKVIGITVYMGGRKGSSSSSDISPEAINMAVEAACNIARFTSVDPCARLIDAELVAKQVLDLDLHHPWNIQPQEAIELSLKCEAHARAHDKRITNSDGAGISTASVYGNSHGFIAGYPTSKHFLQCALIASDAKGMQSDYWFTVARDAKQLQTFEEVANKAATRVVSRLGARHVQTQRTPVIYSAEVASGLLGALMGAISGGALYRKATFLLDHLGKPIFPSFVHIHEQPHRPGALGSAPFDSDGVATWAKDFVQGGVLQNYVMGGYSSRKLGLKTTGNAGGVHNLTIEPTDKGLSSLLKKMQKGLLVTQTMGHGTNLVTGDYSTGVAGFWVENGEIAYPVEEMTVAANLRDMFKNLVAIGDDVDPRSSTHTGSWLLSEMTVAGGQ